MTIRPIRYRVLLALFTTLLFVGCSSTSSTVITPFARGDQTVLSGVVQTGNTDSKRGLADAKVNLYLATGTGDPIPLSSAVSGPNGAFLLDVPKPDTNGILVASASLPNGVELFAIIGPSLPHFVTINELTTVAGAYAGAQLIHDGVLQGGLLPIQIAAGMNANLVDVSTGTHSSVILEGPNADQTNTLRSTRNLANLLAGCVNDPTGNCPRLFELTTPINGPAPTNTIEALLNLARRPAHNVAEIYQQSQIVEPYQPTLDSQPDAWTLAVKVNDTGSPDFPWGGSANTVFDNKGYAWINNNTVQCTTQSTNNIVVLKPDGSPSDGTNGTPKSPIIGGGILGTGFGIARNPSDGHIWVGNFGWGGLFPGPAPGGNGNGSVSELLPDGTPVSGPNGHDGGTNRVQGLIVDPSGNIWTANVGNNKIVVFLDGDPTRTVEAPLECHPFGFAFAPDGTVWATTAGRGLPTIGDPCTTPTSVTHWRLTDNDTLELLSTTVLGADLKGLDIDSEGFVWVSSGGDSKVYRLDPSGNIVGTFQDGGILGPWDVRIDARDNVWVANFGLQVGPPNNIYDKARISVLAGPNSPSGLPVGAPLSPPTGFTLPSAGEPVRLSDGTRLDESGFNQPTFTPLMRQVSIVPDRAGNVWVSNNWKPNYTTNLVENPGGDGMVIFIGLAAPTEPGRTQ